MKILRRILGVFVMIAGILGLLISVAGLVGVWAIKPTLTDYASTTIDTLNESVTTSQNVMKVTGQALGATVDSLDALSTMLSTTAATVDDTAPVLTDINVIMSDTLPSTLQAATRFAFYCSGCRKSPRKYDQVIGYFSFFAECQSIAE